MWELVRYILEVLMALEFDFSDTDFGEYITLQDVAL